MTDTTRFDPKVGDIVFTPIAQWQQKLAGREWIVTERNGDEVKAYPVKHNGDQPSTPVMTQQGVRGSVTSFVATFDEALYVEPIYEGTIVTINTPVRGSDITPDTPLVVTRDNQRSATVKLRVTKLDGSMGARYVNVPGIGVTVRDLSWLAQHLALGLAQAS